MKLRRPRKANPRIRANVELTPLIDVVFQLLIFFMLSATFVIQSSIPIEMPQAEGAEGFEQRDVTVTLQFGSGGPGGGGPIYVDDVAVDSMEQLSRILADHRTEADDVRLLIRGDARVQHGRFVEVLGVANSVGITRFRIAAQAPEEVGD